MGGEHKQVGLNWEQKLQLPTVPSVVSPVVSNIFQYCGGIIITNQLRVITVFNNFVLKKKTLNLYNSLVLELICYNN